MKKDFVLKQKKNPFFTLIKIIVLIIITYIMIGLKDSTQTNNICFSNIIGLDKSNENIENIAVTFQIINPKISSSNSTSSENSYVISTEAKSIDLAISKAQSFISSNIDFSHTNAIIISDELAKEGIERYIRNISSNLKYDNNMYILICNGSTKDFINYLNKSKNIDSLAYFNILKTSQNISGYVEMINLTEFSDKLFTSFAIPIAPICKINSSEKNDNSHNITEISNISSSSNEIDSDNSKDEKNPDNNIEIGGMAIFKNERLIGNLTNDETALHIMLTSKLESYKTSILDEDQDNQSQDYINQKTKSNIELTQTGHAKIKVDTKSDNPKIDITIPINITILDTPIGEYDYLDEDYLSNIKKALIKTLEKKMNTYLYKVQNELGVDVDEFYKYARINFITSEKYRNYNFEEKLKNAKFNVKFNVSFKDPGLNLEK